MIKEIFKDIEGYENLYKISNQGNVKSLERECKGNNGVVYIKKEKILTPLKNKGGYLRVCLSKQGKQKRYFIHRLVASAFIDNPNNYPEINHKDEDKTNNAVSNLEWCTRSYNMNYGTAIQRMIANTDYKAIATKNGKKVLCVETDVVYASTMEVQRELGFNNTHISDCCLGKLKTAYGYTWKYVQ